MQDILLRRIINKMINKNIFFYLAGFIEAEVDKSINWREEFRDKVKADNIFHYDPILYEAIKTNKQAGEHVRYVVGLKQGGHYELFEYEMNRIWWGSVYVPPEMRYQVLTQWRLDKIIRGLDTERIQFMGDYEATVKADAIILYYKNAIPTWGTPGEAELAYFFNIPIFAYSDVPKTQMNSTLLKWIMGTKGDVFYDFKKLCEFIKEKYKIITIEPKN